MSTQLHPGECAPIDMTFTNHKGEQVTVSKHRSGLISCTCMTWRIRHAQDPGPKSLGCQYNACQCIYTARRKGLK